MTNPTFHETMQRDDGSLVTVEFTQGPYYPATGPSWDDPGSPAGGGEIEIVGFFDMDGKSIDVGAERDRFLDELYRKPPREHEPDPDVQMEQRREDCMDGGDW